MLSMDITNNRAAKKKKKKSEAKTDRAIKINRQDFNYCWRLLHPNFSN